jgi:hypothetical protein
MPGAATRQEELSVAGRSATTYPAAGDAAYSVSARANSPKNDAQELVDEVDRAPETGVTNAT